MADVLAPTAAARGGAARAPRFDDVEAGDAIPPFVAPPVSRLQLALFAGAGADANPIHVDDAAAQAGGLPGAIVHGMLTMAFLGELLTRWVPAQALRALEARFVAPAFPGDVITCTGTVVAKTVEAGERRVELDLNGHRQTGAKVLAGRATVALP